MTTESRMREALEETAWAIQELLALINGECPGILDSDRGGSWAQVERIDKALASAMTALSPPARRTSYEWVDYSAWKWQVFYDRKQGGWRYEVRTPRGELVTGIPAYEAAARLTAAIATLAGLEKEEGS